jgi:aminopeptidase N
MFRKLLTLAALSFACAISHAEPFGPPQISVTGYVIHADLDPASGKLTATAAVTFTALQDINLVTFGLNNALQVTSITNDSNTALNSERNVSDSTIQITTAALLPKGSTHTYTFTYSGTPTVDTSPVNGINLAHITDPVSILLYAGRWFPMTGLFTDRFTAQMQITVPKGETVIGSGADGAPKPLENDRVEYDFNWTKSGFPGTIIAGKFLPAFTIPGVSNIRAYVTEKNKEKAHDLASNVTREFEYLTSIFGPAESGRLDVVELPTDTISAAWAPEIIGIRPDRASPRLLTNTIAHQWWGSLISPATLNDEWITSGMSRYAELMYLEETAGKTAFQSAIMDSEAAALSYDTDPLTTLARFDPFSPQFQNETYDKGALVFHMLRWEMGNDVFQKFLQTLVTDYADKPIRTANLEAVAEKVSGLELTPFFSQWIDGTGAPNLGDDYSVFRLGNGKGFRTIGKVTQNLDLFQMPIEISIETEGKTVNRRVDLSGNETSYSIQTFGLPRRIILDPDNWILKTSPELGLRVAVLRGEQAVAQGDLIGAIAEYQKALQEDPNSAIANYRLAEVFFTQHNYQSAANSFRDAIRGDGEPRWVTVWSHIALGQIFDITGQRQRAVNEYRIALHTNDNTQGALNEARALMQKPYKLPNSTD